MIALALALLAQIHEVSYPPSTAPGELVYGVTYTLWIPDGLKTVRGVIVHQHGCGGGACKAGATAAYDLHWQALARKWGCALLGPSYGQEDGQDCKLWCDPRNGSERTFLRALSDLAAKSGHPELADAPWALWGHSGGGTWSSLMLALHPRRVVAAWLRSGTALKSAELPKPELADEVFAVPVLCNPGLKEKGDKRFNGAYTGGFDMFKAWRARGAPIGFAPDPRTSHECGDSRYLAIPWLDACLAARLPERPGDALRRLDPALGKVVALPDAPEIWLPGERVAAAWDEFVKTGWVADATPPAPPTRLKAVATADGTVELAWDVEADLESGLQAFIILRDGKEAARLPEKPVGRFGRPLFQAMTYHDTPEKPLPALRFTDRSPGAEYRVIAVNAAGLRSEPSEPATSR